MGPGVRQGHTSDAPVSVMDLAATFLDYGERPIPEDMDSRSLRPLLEGATDDHREYVLSGLGKWRMACDGRHKYIEGFGEKNLLFDLQEDPREDVNLAGDKPKVAKRLQGVLPERAYGR